MITNNKLTLAKEINISTLTLDKLCNRLHRFIELESEWTDTRQPGWNKEQFLRELPGKWTLSFVAEINGLIVGYIIGSGDKDNQRLSRVNKIVIDKNYHRQGIGRVLMNQYFEASLKQGMNKFELTAMSDYPPANKLYISLGYTRTGETKGKDGEIRNVYVKTIV